MSENDEDDKPTVVLDLNALKKQKLKQEEDLANIVTELEFTVGATDTPVKKQPVKTEPAKPKQAFKVILFDLQSTFFQDEIENFPEGYEYVIAKDLNELNLHLKSKEFQIVVFNYDVNPKAVNQLCFQLKKKLPSTKTLIMARAISPEKAKLHAKTASGANGYYQLPLDSGNLDKEFSKIYAKKKK